MLRLHVLGGASLEGEAGALSGPASQRHRLALLALLALHPRGLSRDKLMAYLWPHRDTEHARKLLNQGVHELRRAIGEASILSAGDELRYNPQVLAADVVEFEVACRASDPAAAVAAYRGPFLDGFFLSGSPEFEEWVERERARLADLHAQALEDLAETAEREGELRRALGWWRRRAAQDPYDSRIALRLVRVLNADGNRAAALQQAAIHARLLQAEFGVDPPPEFTAFVEWLRAEPERGPGSEPAQGAEGTGRTPAAAVRTDDGGVEEREPAPPPSKLQRLPVRRLLPYAAAVLVLIGIAYAGIRPLLREADSSAITVLPLTTFGTDPSETRLAAAMTEEITSLLTQAGGLRVIGSTSALHLSGRHRDVRVIGDSLGVSHVLVGSVQKDSTRLRVTVRLVAARDGATVWSETYDRELDDVFAVQEDVARLVTRELGLRLVSKRSAPRSPPTRNVAAYELYLRGSDPILLRSDSSARRGLEYFRQAIALDPQYAAAYAGLARMYARTSSRGTAAVRAEGLRLAVSAALKALSLDDSLAEAHATLARLRMTMLDVEDAERGLRRAIALDGAQPRFREWLSSLHVHRGRPAEALAEARRALAIDPLSPTANAAVAYALLANDRCDEAMPLLEQLAVLQPPLLRAAPIAAQCHARRGEWAEAIAAIRPQAGADTGLLGYLLARGGERAEAQRVLDSLLEQARNGGSVAFQVAMVYAGLGDLDQSFAWLDRASDDGSMDYMEPILVDQLQEDRRYDLLRARLGLQKR